ncbi:MAG: hypothetical protein KAJ18_03475 [Candidatus Omnitrophica bacterium]|nr:hypothetical protein [Candidatus Omnitrophota bacterium]
MTLTINEYSRMSELLNKFKIHNQLISNEPDELQYYLKKIDLNNVDDDVFKGVIMLAAFGLRFFFSSEE